MPLTPSSNENGDRQKLDEMLTALYDGSLDDAQTEELLRRLEEPEVRDCFAVHAMLDAYLSIGCADPASIAARLRPEFQVGATRCASAICDKPDTLAAPGKSTVLRFRGNLAGGGWQNTAAINGYIVTALTAIGLMLSLAVVVLVLRFPPKPSGREPGGQDIAHQARRIESSPPAVGSMDESKQAASAPIARLACAVDCRWADIANTLRPDDVLRSGSELRLASGIVELDFEIGVRAVIQGPARLDLLTPAKVFLYAGKMTSEVLKPEARGFEVRTPKGSVVDLGTEFGVEVTPSQSVKVHVFKGEVMVQQAALASAAGSRRVVRNQGLRMDGGAAKPVLVEESGENFIRNIDDANRDRHVVAYRRFEDRPLGVVLPDTSRNTRPFLATADSSYNGNDLFNFSPNNGPQFSGNVETARVPQTGDDNRGCLDNTAPPSHNSATRNVYSHSQFSYASPIDLQAIEPAEWTIEASVKVKSLHGNRQTFVVRDGGDGPNDARLAFRINENDFFELVFCDVRHKIHKTVVNESVRANQWYNLAAVSDGATLKIYVDSCGGNGYQLRSVTDLNPQGAGSTALGCSNPDAEWSVGRGCGPSEWFQGWIDEVRISDVARQPDAFLFAARNPAKWATAKQSVRAAATVASELANVASTANVSPIPLGGTFAKGSANVNNKSRRQLDSAQTACKEFGNVDNASD